MKAKQEMKHERKSHESPGAQEMKKQVLPEQKQMEMKMRHQGATGEQHGINTQRTPQRPPEKTMEHKLPGNQGQEKTRKLEPGQGVIPIPQPGQQ